jgi:M6 family metalloprotease-like protein
VLANYEESIMSFPLFGETVQFRQPDGTPFTVRAWGDQHRARFETPDGRHVVQDPSTRYFHFADAVPDRRALRLTSARIGIEPPEPSLPIDAAGRTSPALLPPANAVLLRPRWKERWDQHKAAQRMHMLSGGVMAAPPARQTVGDYLGLCLLVDFPDNPATVLRQDVDAFCNQVGYSGHGNHGSVFDYYLDNSNGKLRYQTIVTPYYRASHPKAYYTDPKVAYGVRAQELIVEALSYHQQHGFDFSKLTADERACAYATNVFYAGEVENNWAEGLWPHASRLATPFKLGPEISAVDYQVTALRSAPVLGTYCHENGHMLCDFPDLYQYSDQRFGVGRYCLMCGGGNAAPLNPVNICAYLKYRAGWGDVVETAPGLQAVLEPGKNRFFLHARQSEYFILENRQQLQRDQALPCSGLAVWHVDELGSNSDPADAPDGHRRHEVTLVEADGRSDLDDGANDGDATDLFRDKSGPIFSDAAPPSSHWWDGTSSGLQIANVQLAAGVLKFEVR